MMDVLKWVPLLILVVLILILLIGNIVIVQQSKAYVVERLGAFRTVWGVGLHLKVPFVERVAKKVSLKEQVADFAPQPVITKGQCHHADRYGDLLPDHGPEAVYLRRGTAHERH